MRIRIKIRKNAIAKRLAPSAPSSTIESGRIGARPGGSPLSIKVRGPSTKRAARIGPAVKQSRPGINLRGPSEKRSARLAGQPAQTPPQRLRLLRKDQMGAVPPRINRPPEHKLEVPIRKLIRRGVPNPQSLTQADYLKKYGVARDTSVPTKAAPATGGVTIVIGPTGLNHQGRLRKTGKPCGHWAMYAYLVEVDGKRCLGVQFLKGFRCYYPSTTEYHYHEIVNEESGSYYTWDHLKQRPYVAF